jgi:hypothetical protein
MVEALTPYCQAHPPTSGARTLFRPGTTSDKPLRTTLFVAPPHVGLASGLLTYIGAAVVVTFIVGGSKVGVCDFPATQASIMSAHSCSM